MEINHFIENYKEAFGQKAELPIVFWYSNAPMAETEKINGCFFKKIAAVRQGELISINAETIGCGGGKLYNGFIEMPPFVP